MRSETRYVKALDLFCGGGGASVGLQRLGYSVTGVDFIADALATCREMGDRTKHRDLSTPYITTEEFDLLWASPPCTAFSIAGTRDGVQQASRLGRAIEREDWDWGRREGLKPDVWLVLSAMQSIVTMKPAAVVMENVPQTEEVFIKCHRVLQRYGYQGQVGVLSAERYGVPQSRKRCFLSMVRDGKTRLPEPTHAEYVPPKWEVRAGRAAERDAHLTPWRSMGEVLGRSDELRTVREKNTRRRDAVPMDEPAPTITAGGAGRHHMKINGLNYTDAALLQAFPRDHPWQGSPTSIQRKIGNAVPPPMAIAVAGEASGMVWQIILDQYLRELYGRP